MYLFHLFAIFLEAIRLLGGDDGIRTHDPLLAGQVLSQLSYTPIRVIHFKQSLKIEQLSSILNLVLLNLFEFYEHTSIRSRSP